MILDLLPAGFTLDLKGIPLPPPLVFREVVMLHRNIATASRTASQGDHLY